MISIAFLLLSCISIAEGNLFVSEGEDGDKTNVLMILTDEQNIRTIGKYRELLGASSSDSSQAFVWGENIKVTTPNLDSLAEDGVTFENFYTASPVCTTARGSLFSGQYPTKNGAKANSVAMNSDVSTWAHVLSENGYHTGYMGKWHLDGKVKGRKAFGAPEGRAFGFQDNEYRWNRGHWKCLQRRNGKLKGFTYKQCLKNARMSKNLQKSYTTDFLTRKAIGYMKQRQLNNETFALVLSIPDPHNPNQVRPPYDKMFSNIQFKMPETAKMALKKSPAIPKWAFTHKNYRNVPASQSEQRITEIESSSWYQNQQKSIFGMVKLIDDKLGQILTFLETSGLEENTLVMFTSDHGDLMHEHAKMDKVLPYHASAAVPMIMRWPGKIKKGKVIHSIYSTVDFAPTLLGMLQINYDHMDFDGIDASDIVLNDSTKISNSSQVRYIDGPNGRYAAALNERYKLVLNRGGTPWLFDMKEDPDEIYNYYQMNETAAISNELKDDLVSVMEEHNFGMLFRGDPIYLDKPICEESRNSFNVGVPGIETCEDLENSQDFSSCDSTGLFDVCPVSCRKCVKDSTGTIIFSNDKITCDNQVKDASEMFCQEEWIYKFCLDTCSTNTAANTTRFL